MEFRVLGPLEVAEGNRVLDIGPRLPRTLLALLLIDANTVVSLDRLLDCLWGEHPPATAGTALQNYVARLRRVLEGDRPARTPPRVVVTQAPGYVLRVDSDQLDACRFEALLETGRAQLGAGRYARAGRTLRSALSLWRGSPYADLAFERCLQIEIARLDELRAIAAEALAEANLGAGDHMAAVADLERLAVAEPLRERRWELLALALYRSGRQVDALRALAQARRIVGEELGIDVSAALRRLEDSILAQDPSLDWGQASEIQLARRELAESSPPVLERPFVGREGEREALRAALTGAIEGRGRVALVAGEPGIGKTRLIEVVAEEAAGHGALVAWGRCHQDEVAPAFWPWVEVIGSLMRDDEAAIRAALAGRAAQISQIVPAVKDLFDRELDPLPVLNADTARAHLCDALGQFVRALSSQRPLLIVIDDLHWADGPSLEMLQLIAPQVRDARALVVCAYREVEAKTSVPVVATLARLGRQPAVTKLRLQGLSERDVGRLAEASASVVVDEDVARIIHARTEGNPFFVTELVTLLRPGDTSLVTTHIPTGVRETIDLHLATVPHDVRECLVVGALIGREFDLETVAAARQQDPNRTLEQLEAALSSGLLIEGDEVGAYRFSHSLVRETIAGGLTAVRRARLHRDIGQVLEALNPEHPPYVELARHFLEAAGGGWDEKAYTYALRLAEQAQAGLAYEQAEEQLRSALALASRLSPGAERWRRELDTQQRLAALLSFTRGYHTQAVVEAWAGVREAARRLDDIGEVVAATLGQARAARGQGQLLVAHHLGEELLAMSEAASNREIAIAGHECCGVGSYYQGHLRAAAEHFGLAVRLGAGSAVNVGRDAPPIDPVAYATAYLAATNLFLGSDPEQCLALSEEAVRRARASGRPLAEGLMQILRMLLYSLLRDLEATITLSEEILASSEKNAMPFVGMIARAFLWRARAYEGDASIAAEEVARAVRELGATGWRLGWTYFMLLLSESFLQAGQLDRALQMVEAGLAETTSRSEHAFEPELLCLKADILVASGAPSRTAEQLIRRARAIADSQECAFLVRRAEEALTALAVR
jgi:DNA-binding SARP family transcriptional activator